MSKGRHTPGPLRGFAGAVVRGDGQDIEYVANCNGNDLPIDECEANAVLYAAAPDLLAELNDTAVWLTSRAEVLRRTADGSRLRPSLRTVLRDEAARLEGRAAVIRQTILKAAGG